MRKSIITSILICFLLGSICPVFAIQRGQTTKKGFTSSQLVKRGDTAIYSITFVATAALASFTIYDCLTIIEGTNTNVKTEGSRAVSGNGDRYDFGRDTPLEMSTGCYLVVKDMNVIIEYD